MDTLLKPLLYLTDCGMSLLRALALQARHRHQQKLVGGTFGLDRHQQLLA